DCASGCPGAASAGAAAGVGQQQSKGQECAGAQPVRPHRIPQRMEALIGTPRVGREARPASGWNARPTCREAVGPAIMSLEDPPSCLILPPAFEPERSMRPEPSVDFPHLASPNGPRIRFRIGWLALVVLGFAVAPTWAAPPEPVDFRREILPILSEN